MTDPPPTSTPHFTEPTTTYWQSILPSSSPLTQHKPPYQYGYPAILPGCRIFILPIRQLAANQSEAVASLILNQASISVAEELGQMLAEIVREYEPEVVIGLPTLGLGCASTVARSLGMERYVPLGYSRKFWYQDTLSTEVSSITSPNGEKRSYLDPNQLALVKGKKVIIIDDAVSSGKTLLNTWEFLESEEVGCEVVIAGLLMKQGGRWKGLIGEERIGKVKWVFESPLLRWVEGGWEVRE